MLAPRPPAGEEWRGRPPLDATVRIYDAAFFRKVITRHDTGIMVWPSGRKRIRADGGWIKAAALTHTHTNSLESGWGAGALRRSNCACPALQQLALPRPPAPSPPCAALA